MNPLFISVRKRTLFLLLAVIGLGAAILAVCYFAVSRKSVLPPGVPADSTVPGMVRFETAPYSTPALPAGPRGEAAAGADGFFVDLKIERDRARGWCAASLKEVIRDESSSNEMKQKAQQELISLARNMSKELELEGLIKAKGYQDAAVMLENQVVTVIVAAPRLSGEEAGSLVELISKAAGVDAKNVMLVQKNPS